MRNQLVLICLFFAQLGLVLKIVECQIFKDYDELKSNFNDHPRALKLISEEATNATDVNSTMIENGTSPNDDRSASSKHGLSNTNISTTSNNAIPTTTNTPITRRETETINNLLNQITSKYPDLTKSINRTLNNINLNDTSGFLLNLSKSNSSIIRLYNGTEMQKEINKTKDAVEKEIAKAVLQHQAETALRNLNKTLTNSSFDVFKNQSQISRNFNPKTGLPQNKVTKKVDLNPSLWLARLHAPWKHVSESEQENSTEVIQACKFDLKSATCSAEFIKWRIKVWFQFAEAPLRKGINLTVFEHGHKSRVTFYNKVNGTDCQVFENGTFHQICLKVYSYDKKSGPTRVCFELGAALFNHGVSSTDYGCFKFSYPVIHDEPSEGEAPPLTVLSSYILGNQYNNFRYVTSPNSGSRLFNYNFLFIFIITFLIVR